MPLQPQEVRLVLSAARNLPLTSPPERVEEFVGRVLQLNPVNHSLYFPIQDPTGTLALAVSHLTKEREKILGDECTIPSFTVYHDPLNVAHIAGFSTHLAYINMDQTLRARLAHFAEVQSELRRIKHGPDLEALAAAILNKECDFGEATQGSGDQGIDAIGWKELVLIEASFSSGDISAKEILPGEKVFLFASSKAFTFGPSKSPKLINPAHIRELVGGWVIQRSSAGTWQNVGIRMLSPVQMILVTTYRLSPDAKAECRSLGVQVWGLPELIYLVCRAAPANVFDATANFTFSSKNFREWWKERDIARRKRTRK